MLTIASLILSPGCNGEPQEAPPPASSASEPTCPAIDRSGTAVVYSSDNDGDYEIYVRTDGNDTRLTDNGQADRQPTWSPDGTQVAFVRVERNDGLDEQAVWVLDLALCEERCLTEMNWEHDRFPAWSPNGQQIAFSSTDAFEEDGESISLVKVEGGRPRTVLEEPDSASLADPSWGSNKLAFIYELGSLATSRLCCQEPNVVTTSPATKSAPSWSPNANMILFSQIRYSCPRNLSSESRCRTHRDNDLFVYDLDSDALRRLVGGKADSTAGTWSPDGRRVIFFDNRSGSYDLYQVSIDGRDMERLTSAPSNEVDPDVLDKPG